MNNQNKNNLGEEIRNIVQNALNNDDFKSLNRDIQNITKGALGEVKSSFNWQGNIKHSSDNQFNKIDLYRQRDKQRVTPLKKSKYTVPVGKTSGVLLTIFGGIGTGAFGIAVLVLTLLGFAIGGKVVFHTVALGLLPLLIVSIISLTNGNRIRKRLKRFQKYLGRMHNRDYYLIRELSAVTGQSDKATARDLQRMIASGMFPEGHIDDKGTYFMLNNKAHEEYLKLKEGMKLKELEEKKKQNMIQASTNGRENLTPEMKRTIDEGRQFVEEIQNANIAIPGEEISRKLDRLEEVTGKIFDYVLIHPEKLPEIKKFMEYFLPTTLKLLDAYKKLDNQPVEGPNIRSSKKEIEDTIDTINQAFENLLDDLFEDLAMDISTDISVLETIFAQEGLIDNSIRTNSRMEED